MYIVFGFGSAFRKPREFALEHIGGVFESYRGGFQLVAGGFNILYIRVVRHGNAHSLFA
jgi:hypothetical protein